MCEFEFQLYGHSSMDFVNVHLFHDESNLALIHENPSLYSDNRKRALDYVLEQVAEQSNGCLTPLFIFGDLNFRLNTPSFLNKITEDSELVSEEQSHSEINVELCAEQCSDAEFRPIDPLRRTVSAVEFRRSPCEFNNDDPGGDCVLRIEKKRFDYFNHKKLLKEWKQYLGDDRELLNFPTLFECPIGFPPTYPWSEDPDHSEALLKTRAPAWCDRVLMNSAAWKLAGDTYCYASIGQDTCMGDHKPVMLVFSLAT